MDSFDSGDGGGGGDVSFDADFTGLGDTSLGDTSFGDTNLGDTNLGDTNLGDPGFVGTGLGDTGFIDTGFGSAQVFGDGGQGFGQPDDNQFSLTGQDTTQIDVNVDVNVDFGNTDGSGGFETVGNNGGFNDIQYGPVDRDLGTGADPLGDFDNTQYGSGIDINSNDVITNGSMLDTVNGSIDTEVQIEAGPDPTYVGDVNVGQQGGNDWGDMSQGERAVPDYGGDSHEQGVTMAADYEGAGYGPSTPGGGSYGGATDQQDASDTPQCETQAQGDQLTIDNSLDEKASGSTIWIDPNSVPIRPPTTYNPLTSASLSGPLTDFYDGFEPFNTTDPAELNSSLDLDDQPYPNEPPMFPSLKRPLTQVDAIFPTSSDPLSLPQITETAVGTVAAPDYEGAEYGPMPVQDDTAPDEPQNQAFQLDQSSDPSQNSNGVIPSSQGQPIPQTTPGTASETTQQIKPEKIPEKIQQIPSSQATVVPFEPPLNIAPTTMNATI